VRVAPEPFAPDCSSACRHATPEASSPHHKPSSAFWNQPLFCITAPDCNSGCLVGAVPTAFRTLCGSNHCMPACLCAYLDVNEQTRAFVLCDGTQFRAHTTVPLMAGCGTSTNGVKNTHRPSLGSEGALRGLGSHPAVEDLPPRRLGWGRRRNPHLHPPQGRGRCARPAARVP
jgi:hypothetical protein